MPRTTPTGSTLTTTRVKLEGVGHSENNGRAPEMLAMVLSGNWRASPRIKSPTVASVHQRCRPGPLRRDRQAGVVAAPPVQQQVDPIIGDLDDDFFEDGAHDTLARLRCRIRIGPGCLEVSAERPQALVLRLRQRLGTDSASARPSGWRASLPVVARRRAERSIGIRTQRPSLDLTREPVSGRGRAFRSTTALSATSSNKSSRNTAGETSARPAFTRATSSTS